MLRECPSSGPDLGATLRQLNTLATGSATLEGGTRRATASSCSSPTRERDRPGNVHHAALTFMNGVAHHHGSRSLVVSQTLLAVCETPEMSTPDRNEGAVLQETSRRPTAKELDCMTKFIADGGS